MATQIEDRAETPAEQRFLLRGVDWETYQAVSEALSGRHVRLTHEPHVRGSESIDLTLAPPPNLAIEVDISRSSRDRLSIYAALGVPEISRFDGSALHVYQLQDDGSYTVAGQSSLFPFLSISEIVGFLHRRAEMDENRLIRDFRQWVRGQVDA